MNRLLVRKYLHESLLLLLACGSMLFVFCWARVWIVCQFDLQKFKPLLEQFRAFERFSPIPLEQFLTYTGSIAMGFNEPVLILCIVVWGVSRGSDVVSGEIGRGTMEMLLAQPISRLRLLMIHGIICITGLAGLCGVAWLGTYVGIQTNTVKQSVTPTIDIQVPFLPLTIPFQTGEEQVVEVPLIDEVAPSLFALPTLNLFGFGFFLLALSVMCSCFDRYRWRTIGLVIGFYVIQLLLFLLSRATDWTSFCSNLTFFSLYQPDGMVQLAKRAPEASFDLLSSVSVIGWPYVLGPLGMTGLLIAMGLAMYAVGTIRFCTRDLPAAL